MDIKKTINGWLSNLFELLRFVPPHTRGEWGIFLFFLVLYLSYTLIIILKTYLIDYPDSYAVDLYFSFDTPHFFKRGYENIEGHPLLVYLHMPASIVGNLFDICIGGKARAVWMGVVCSTTIAISIMYVYRYLQQVLLLRNFPLIALSLFFGFMSTNLMLAFTPESFTTSTFLLTLSVCYFSIKISRQNEVPLVNGMMLTVLLGGATITNFAKGVIMMLFEKEKKIHILQKIIATGLTFSICLAYIVVTKEKVLQNLTNKVVQFMDVASGVSFFEKTFDYFFGSAMFWPHIVWRQHPVFVDNKGWIICEVYHHWWQYLFVFSTLALLLVSLVKNRNEKLVQMLGLLFLFDIILHIVLRYGLSESYIYGAHWIYVVPLLLGWLYKSVDTAWRKICIALFSVLLVMMIVNNITEMYNFVSIAVEQYSTSTLVIDVGRPHLMH